MTGPLREAQLLASPALILVRRLPRPLNPERLAPRTIVVPFLFAINRAASRNLWPFQTQAAERRLHPHYTTSNEY